MQTSKSKKQSNSERRLSDAYTWTKNVKIPHAVCVCAPSDYSGCYSQVRVCSLGRGKLISTILDWEDSLPDRDLNRADEACRYGRRIF